jgi:arabinofuranosyltransferase
VSDDGYITFRVVDTLWSGYGPNFNPGERVQAYTHPLWFFYLAASGRLGIDLYYVAVLGGVACAAGTGYLVARLLPPVERGRRGPAARDVTGVPQLLHLGAGELPQPC